MLYNDFSKKYDTFIMRNPIAKALRSLHLQPKIVKPKKGPGSYTRKAKSK